MSFYLSKKFWRDVMFWYYYGDKCILDGLMAQYNGDKYNMHVASGIFIEITLYGTAAIMVYRDTHRQPLLFTEI